MEKDKRRESAYFYNERNLWFSDVWDVRGVSQKGVSGSRCRNGSYPLEIPYRLINMFSIYDDVVFDPFNGLGTTQLAALIYGRNSVGCEVDTVLCDYTLKRLQAFKDYDKYITQRLKEQKADVTLKKYFNSNLNINVKTKQEEGIKFRHINSIAQTGNIVVADYI